MRRIDLHALCRREGVNLGAALDALKAIYADLDARNARNTSALNLPCTRGCSACCEESVLLSPLEFYAVWDHLQTTCDDATLAQIVADGLALYHAHKDVIAALNRPPPPGERDHTALLRDVRFRCPMLDGGGACRAYPVREIKGRLFGCSFNDDGGIYGCHLVGAHLADKLVTLTRARPHANRVAALPLGTGQQLYPFYIHALYGSG